MKTIQIGEMVKFVVLASLVFLGMPEWAAAAGANDDINSLFHEVAEKQLGGLPYILSVVCYVAGTFMLVSGALSLKKHAENPTSEPMSKGIARLVVGGAITSVPALSGIIQRSTAVLGADEADYTDFKVSF